MINLRRIELRRRAAGERWTGGYTSTYSVQFEIASTRKWICCYCFPSSCREEGFDLDWSGRSYFIMMGSNQYCCWLTQLSKRIPSLLCIVHAAMQHHWWRCGFLLYKGIRGVMVQGKIMITWDSVNSFIMRYAGKLNTSGHCGLTAGWNLSWTVVSTILRRNRFQSFENVCWPCIWRGTCGQCQIHAVSKMWQLVCWPNNVILILSCHQPLSSRSININRTLQKKEHDWDWLIPSSTQAIAWGGNAV